MYSEGYRIRLDKTYDEFFNDKFTLFLELDGKIYSADYIISRKDKEYNLANSTEKVAIGRCFIEVGKLLQNS